MPESRRRRFVAAERVNLAARGLQNKQIKWKNILKFLEIKDISSNRVSSR